MKLLQFHTETGKLRGGVLQPNGIQLLSAPVLRLLTMATRAGMPIEALLEVTVPDDKRLSYAELEAQGQLCRPIDPPEVWGAGVTYRPSADFRDADMEHGSGIYGGVYRAARPELFFKATASRCVGPYQPIGLREDAAMTAPEPELAVVIAADGRIIGYTLANDVSAWSIERENPLYLPQSKTYRGCCALGPVLVTADEIRDPRALALRCRILRGGRPIFEGQAPVSQMKREIPELVDYLLRCNEVPDGTVLMTGTGIIVPHEAALAEGDVVEIECDPIGMLRNTCRTVPARRSSEANV